jgi:hypothetical protein
LLSLVLEERENNHNNMKMKRYFLGFKNIFFIYSTLILFAFIIIITIISMRRSIPKTQTDDDDIKRLIPVDNIDFIEKSRKTLNSIFQYSAEFNELKNHSNCEIYNRNNEEIELWSMTKPLHDENQLINFNCLNKKIEAKNIKTILIWNENLSKFDDEEESSGIGEKIKCPVNNCKVTFNRESVEKSDLLIWDVNDNKKSNWPLIKRSNIEQRRLFVIQKPLQEETTYNLKYYINNNDWFASFTSTLDFVSLNFRYFF